jgi:hypothetical protein
MAPVKKDAARVAAEIAAEIAAPRRRLRGEHRRMIENLPGCSCPISGGSISCLGPHGKPHSMRGRASMPTGRQVPAVGLLLGLNRAA